MISQPFATLLSQSAFVTSQAMPHAPPEQDATPPTAEHAFAQVPQ